MIVPLLRYVADRLTDPVTGYAALRTAAPKDASDAPPPAVRVLTAADAPVFALGGIDPTLTEDGPALLVTHVATAAGTQITDAATATVAVRYAAEPSATFAFDAYQALAVATRALVAPIVSAGMAGQYVVRNGVAIGAPSGVTIVEPPPDAGDAFVPALLVTYLVHSPWLLGA